MIDIRARSLNLGGQFVAGSALVLASVGLAGCSDNGGTAAGAVSEGEARALEEAAEMLDERSLPEGVIEGAPAVPDPSQTASEPANSD